MKKLKNAGFFMICMAVCGSMISCKKGDKKDDRNTPSTPISTELEGLWLNNASVTFGFTEVQIFNSNTGKWLWEEKGYPDPWDLDPDIAERGIQFGNVTGQGRFIEASQQNAGNTQYNITYKEGSVAQDGNKIILYPWTARIATRSSATGGSATLDGDKSPMIFTYTIELDYITQTRVRKKLSLKAANGETYYLFSPELN